MSTADEARTELDATTRPTLVVFEGGRWWATPPGGRDPQPLDRPAARPTLTDDAGSDPSVVVEALDLNGPTVLRADRGRLWAWVTTDQAEVELDELDVTLLTGTDPDAAIERANALPIGPARLVRLAATGLVTCTVRDVPPATSVSQVNLAAAPPFHGGRLRSIARSARARLTPAAPPTVAAPATVVPSTNGRQSPPVAPSLTTDPVAGAATTAGTVVASSVATSGRIAADDPRTRVVATWDIETWGQPLALGGLLAYAKVAWGGRLNEHYDLLPTIDHGELTAVLDRCGGPAVVLLSDYIWSADRNREVAREVEAHDPRHLVVHGGPHVPKFRGDKQAFFEEHQSVDVIVHGEGEITLAALLDALKGDPTAQAALASVAGISYRTAAGPVDTPERPRHDQLADFPSPYLTGEFDHLDPSAWQWPSVETNRGCPYSCTFCDWGSATRSRIRDFPLDRVIGELDWLAAHGMQNWMINDANFGIHRRDIDITSHVVDLKRRHGVPSALYLNYAKNTVKYLAEIVGMLTEHGITGEGALALQTRDPETLRAIKRSNIRTDKYDELAEEFRRYGLPLVTDLIIGMPGQTVGSLLDDMQYCFDNEVTPRFFVALNLPNAEFNDPEYRERFQIVLGDGNVVVQTTSFTLDDRQRMMRLRMAFRAFEHFGILRQLLHWLQWDHGVRAADALDRVEARIHRDPDRYPLASWALGYLDILLIPPYGWLPFYEEVAALICDEFEVDDGPELRTVLAVQTALMPSSGKSFPLTTTLDHDYAAWYHDHKSRSGGGRPLATYGSATFTVAGDPTSRCTDVIGRITDERPHDLITTAFWAAYNWELDSPLQRLVPETAVSEAEKRLRTA